GAIVAWTDLYPTGVQTRLSLPTYPFNRQSFWLNTGSSQHAEEAHSPSAQIQQFVECWEKEDVSQSMPIGFSTVVYVLAQDTEQAWLEADSEDVTHVVFCRVDELESQADYERLFAQLQSEGKSVDAVVYVSTGEDDYGHIHTLLQGLHSLTKRPSQLLLVGIAQTALSGCAQESWIGYARSLSMSLARVSCRVLLLSEPEAVITEELGHRGSSVVRYRAGERSVP
ncbi:hypothetical protein, partial [Pseudoalteromonas holothuriae]|uniref:hypothetical protein n=1 Tax=Pseudoalteromonas holothuriae TaxID=2963714 RepID=UPI0021BFA629